MNRFAKDQNLADEVLPMTLFDFNQTFLFCLAGVLLVCYSLPWLIITIPFLLHAFFIVRQKYSKCAREIKRMEAITRSPIYSDFSSTLDGLSTLKAYSLERRVNLSFQTQLNKNSKVWFNFLLISRWLGFRLDLESAFLLIGILSSIDLFLFKKYFYSIKTLVNINILFIFIFHSYSNTLFILIAVSIMGVYLRDSIDIGLIGYAIVNVMSLSGLLQWYLIKYLLNFSV